MIELESGEIILNRSMARAIEVVPADRNYIVVLRSPSNPSRGVALPDNVPMDFDIARLLAERARLSLDISDEADCIDENMYACFIEDPTLRRDVAILGNSLREIQNIGKKCSGVSSSTMCPDETVVDFAESSLPIGTQSDEESDSFCTASQNLQDQECPICMDSIRNENSVKCVSQPPHYFHDACLGRWINQFRRGNPSCPMCRQEIEVDTQLLSEYLNNPLSQVELTDEDRRRLQYLVNSRLSRWTVIKTALGHLRSMADVPLYMELGTRRGFNNLTMDENERINEGLILMRSFLRVAYDLFQDGGRTYPTSPTRPHSYAVKWFRVGCRRLLDWTFLRLQITEEEIERARDMDGVYIQRFHEDTSREMDDDTSRDMDEDTSSNHLFVSR